jgi:hypothetical protein
VLRVSAVPSLRPLSRRKVCFSCFSLLSFFFPPSLFCSQKKRKKERKNLRALCSTFDYIAEIFEESRVQAAVNRWGRYRYSIFFNSAKSIEGGPPFPCFVSFPHFLLVAWRSLSSLSVALLPTPRTLSAPPGSCSWFSVLQLVLLPVVTLFVAPGHFSCQDTRRILPVSRQHTHKHTNMALKRIQKVDHRADGRSRVPVGGGCARCFIGRDLPDGFARVSSSLYPCLFCRASPSVAWPSNPSVFADQHFVFSCVCHRSLKTWSGTPRLLARLARLGTTCFTGRRRSWGPMSRRIPAACFS